MGDLGNTVLGTYDTGQTNRVSSCLGSGVPARLAILGSVGGSAHPCTLPLVWGRLHGSLLTCLRKDVALVWHCVPGLERETPR